MNSGFLSGQKTYILAALSVLTAWALYAVGTDTLAQAIQLTITAALGATIRAGVTSEAAKLKPPAA